VLVIVVTVVRVVVVIVVIVLDVHALGGPLSGQLWLACIATASKNMLTRFAARTLSVFQCVM